MKMNQFEMKQNERKQINNNKMKLISYQKYHIDKIKFTNHLPNHLLHRHLYHQIQ